MKEMINWMGGWPERTEVGEAEWRERWLAGRSSSQAGADADGAAGEWARRYLRGAGAVLLARGADDALRRLIERRVRPGDVVLTERLASRQALRQIARAGASAAAVPGDERGMDPGALAEAVARIRPRLVYAAPSCTDPEGRIWSEERVAAAVRICEERGTALLLDRRQALLRFDRDDASAPEWAAPGGEVLEIGEIPPGLLPGARVGWIASRSRTRSRMIADAGAQPPAGLSAAREAAFAADALAALDWLTDTAGAQALRAYRSRVRGRMERLHRLLAAGPWPEVSGRFPQGGLHYWLRLPEGLSGEILLRNAWRKGMLFQPGAAYYADRPEWNAIRLTAVHSDEEEIDAGVSRLFEAIGDFLGRWEGD